MVSALPETVDVTDAGECSCLGICAFIDVILGKAVTYTMSVGVGNPPTQYNLLIDTGQWTRLLLDSP